MDVQKQVILLIKHVLHDTKHQINTQAMSDDDKKAVVQYSTEQGVLLFLYEYPVFREYMQKHGLSQKINISIYQQSFVTGELKTILDAFEEAKIDCVLLKGTVTRELYPNPILRSMGDIDLLYRHGQTKELQQVMRTLGYVHGGDMVKHDHYTKKHVLVEMHKTLGVPGWKEQEYFDTIWDQVYQRGEYQHIYDMTPEDHYLFTFTHLVEHFKMSGIGIRMVMDMYVLSQNDKLDYNYIDKRLKQFQYQEFHANILEVANIWFSNEDTRVNVENCINDLEEYILNGGVFGNSENVGINIQLEHGNRLNFIMNVLFPKYQAMQTVYSWLKTPLFLPVAWLCRGWGTVLCRRGHVKIQMARVQNFGEQQQELSDREQFFKKYGLQKRTICGHKEQKKV